jgi:hypothetical protein
MAEEQSPIKIGRLMGWSVLAGFALFLLTVFTNVITQYFPSYSTWYMIALFILFYLVPLFVTIGYHNDTCNGHLDWQAAAIGSFWSYLYIVASYVITANFEFIRSIVESCLYSDELKTVKALEESSPWIKQFALGYYVFFFTIIGMVKGGGMSIKCSP